MSISSTLSNALSGMSAASRMAEVVSSNVSNSLTDGYGRRTLNLSAAVIGGHGAGVEIGSITRHVDRGILSDRRLADASLGEYGALVSTVNRIQDVMGIAGNQGSISSRIVALESALVDAASDPSSEIRLTSLFDRLEGVANGLNQASRDIQSERVRADKSISNQIDRLNTALAQVEQLNSDITYSRNTGIDPSGLMDQRQRAIDTIAEIVPVRELDRDGGQVALMTPDGESLIDGKAKVFGFSHTPVITSDMTLHSSGLFGITLDGAQIASDGIGKLVGGTLGAAFAARDIEFVSAQAGLDIVAADLITRFQDPSVDQTILAGQPGFFTDAGTAFASADTSGLAARISVNSLINPDTGGSVSKLRDGLNATSLGLSGNANLLLSLSAAVSSPQMIGTDMTQQSAAGRAASFESEIGSRRLMFEAEMSFASARWASLKEAETADGVNTDYEMQTLLRVEQAYAANARVVQTVESLMQRLMEI